MTHRSKDTTGPRPYLVATAIVLAIAYLALIVWVALLSPDVIGHNDKGLALLLLVVVPGKYVLDTLLQRIALATALHDRIHLLIFVGLCIGWIEIEETVGFWDSSLTFVGAFVLSAAAVFVFDVMVDWLKAKWMQRKTRQTR